MGQGEGLLIDCGAVGNLVGSDWVQRTEEIAKAFGQRVQRSQMSSPLNVGGVGKGTVAAEQQVSMPISLPDGSVGTFTAPVVEGAGSGIPALLGLETQKRLNFLIDPRNKKLYQVGEGGYKISLSPGSRTYDLVQTASGHLLLPITEWKKVSKNQPSGPLSSKTNAKNQFAVL